MGKREHVFQLKYMKKIQPQTDVTLEKGGTIEKHF